VSRPHGRVAPVAALALLALAGAALTAARRPARAATGSDVRYVPAADVRAAFDHGAVLLDAGSYMVHASRRDAAGMAEVHLKDTDIVHVLHGAATIVTGGAVVGGRTTAPDEMRGVSIEGGSERRLAEGDVLVVPRGVPHWFREVDAPFLYYVVKVR
jgi:mannose-6-phosphate isomerase-like protein (cupin superfamily)